MGMFVWNEKVIQTQILSLWLFKLCSSEFPLGDESELWIWKGFILAAEFQCMKFGKT